MTRKSPTRQRTAQSFAAQLAAAEAWAGVRLSEADVEHLQALNLDPRYRRQLAEARRFAAELSRIPYPDWESVADGETLAVLISAYAAVAQGVSRLLPERYAALPPDARRSLYTACCALAAIDRGDNARQVLRALTLISVLRPRALEELARRFDRHVGSWAGAFRLQADDGDPNSDGSLGRLRRAAKALARRGGLIIRREQLDDALVMALAELAGGKVYPLSEQAAAAALDGKLDIVHVRAVNRARAAARREIRRRRTITFEVEGPESDPHAEGTAPTESPERTAAATALKDYVERDPKQSAVLGDLLNGGTQKASAERLGVTDRTVRTHVRALRRLIPVRCG